jgi:predicted nucleic acid-binding protein
VIVVCDASPIIGLSAVGKLPLLQQLYGKILIPESVAREIMTGSPGQPGADDLQSSDWITIQTVGDSVLLRALDGELDRGEAEAIALAVELRAELLLVDERRARKVAARLGLAFVGVLGVLVEAKRKGFLVEVRPVLAGLTMRAGFRIKSDLYSLVLRAANEESDPELRPTTDEDDQP